MNEHEDNLTIDEVISICRLAKSETIELHKHNPLNTKTRDFIEKYNLTENKIVKIINNLVSEDYHSGPLQDYNPNNKHPLWVFIKQIGITNIKIGVYIKIKIINHRKKIIIYSLHEEGLHNETK